MNHQRNCRLLTVSSQCFISISFENLSKLKVSTLDSPCDFTIILYFQLSEIFNWVWIFLWKVVLEGWLVFQMKMKGGKRLEPQMKMIEMVVELWGGWLNSVELSQHTTGLGTPDKKLRTKIVVSVWRVCCGWQWLWCRCWRQCFNWVKGNLVENDDGWEWWRWKFDQWWW